MGNLDVVVNLDELERGGPPPENHHQHATPSVPWSEYHDTRVKRVLKQRPWLGILDEFLEPSSDSFAVATDHRLSFFNVAVIHITMSGGVDKAIPCNNLDEFEKAVSNGDNRSGTVVIAEDLSRAVTDALGMKYNIEPEFFADHLRGTESFRKGRWQPQTVRSPNILPDCLRKGPYYTAEFRRPYDFPGGFKEIAELRSRKTSTPRGAQIIDGLADAFVFEKISVYQRRGSTMGSAVGIILTDKLLSDDPPRPHVLDPVSVLDDDSDAQAPEEDRSGQVSCQKELVRWFERLSHDGAKAVFDEPLALRPILKIVERASAMFLSHARYTMSRIVTGHCDEQFPDSIPFALRVSRDLHRHIHDQQKLLRSNLRVASLKGAGDIADQIQDIRFLTEDLEWVLKALEEDVQFLVSTASITEAKLVTWVSKFAFLFLPVTTVATILSISEPGYTKYAIFGGLTVPFVVVSMFFMFFWKPSHRDSLRRSRR